MWSFWPNLPPALVRVVSVRNTRTPPSSMKNPSIGLPVFGLVVLYAVTVNVSGDGFAPLTPTIAFASPPPSSVDFGHARARIMSGAHFGRPFRLNFEVFGMKTSRSDIVRFVLLFTM